MHNCLFCIYIYHCIKFRRSWRNLECTRCTSHLSAQPEHTLHVIISFFFLIISNITLSMSILNIVLTLVAYHLTTLTSCHVACHISLFCYSCTATTPAYCRVACTRQSVLSLVDQTIRIAYRDLFSTISWLATNSSLRHIAFFGFFFPNYRNFFGMLAIIKIFSLVLRISQYCAYLSFYYGYLWLIIIIIIIFYYLKYSSYKVSRTLH